MKEKFKKLFPFLLMHLGFFIYSLYAVAGKFASHEEFLSIHFIMLYILALFILILYAFIWQKVLKYFPLGTAFSNKTITIVWGIFFGKIIFDESIKINMIIGAAIILTGIFLLNRESKGNEA
ncbi:MAG: transporter [Treponema sp.]|nr:transporter [Treponema sp.]